MTNVPADGYFPNQCFDHAILIMHTDLYTWLGSKGIKFRKYRNC